MKLYIAVYEAMLLQQPHTSIPDEIKIYLMQYRYQLQLQGDQTNASTIRGIQ